MHPSAAAQKYSDAVQAVDPDGDEVSQLCTTPAPSAARAAASKSPWGGFSATSSILETPVQH
eukprot:7220108-Pyramimonas_sp.AAC.1